MLLKMTDISSTVHFMGERPDCDLVCMCIFSFCSGTVAYHVSVLFSTSTLKKHDTVHQRKHVTQSLALLGKDEIAASHTLDPDPKSQTTIKLITA